MGNSFQDVGANSETLSLSEITADGLAGGDMVRFWNGQSYDNVFYYSVNDEGGVYTDDSYEECLGAGWGDINQIAVDTVIPVGEGFWVKNAGAATVTFSGEVPSVTTVSISAGLTLVAVPYPKAIDLASVSASGLAGGDMARFWNGSTYENVFYYSTADEGGVYTDDSYEECLGAGWGDINQIAVSRTIDISKGFWIKSAASATLSFPSL